jgi:hypothetical protein
MPIITGKPGIPPGWVMLRCGTGWANNDKRQIPKAVKAKIVFLPNEDFMRARIFN